MPTTSTTPKLISHFRFNLHRKPTKAERKWLADVNRIVALEVNAAIDTEALLREYVKGVGFTKFVFRTPEQIAAFRKRSESAKLGWKRLRKNRYVVA